MYTHGESTLRTEAPFSNNGAVSAPSNTRAFSPPSPFAPTTLSYTRFYKTRVQGYLAHKKTPTPLGLPWDPRHEPTAGS